MRECRTESSTPACRSESGPESADAPGAGANHHVVGIRDVCSAVPAQRHRERVVPRLPAVASGDGASSLQPASSGISSATALEAAFTPETAAVNQDEGGVYRSPFTIAILRTLPCISNVPLNPFFSTNACPG